MHEPFEASTLIVEPSITVTKDTYFGDPVMCIVVMGTYVYITKEQAMKFFGLIEQVDINDPRLAGRY